MNEKAQIIYEDEIDLREVIRTLLQHIKFLLGVCLSNLIGKFLKSKYV